MVSLHDHFVRQLLVDADAKQLRLQTAYPHHTGPQLAEAIFEGVAGYVMDGDALGTILFDVEEVDAMALFDRFAEKLTKSFRENGGHASWAESREHAERFFSTRVVRGFDITSSIGLTAAVWAHSLTTRWLENP